MTLLIASATTLAQVTPEQLSSEIGNCVQAAISDGQFSPFAADFSVLIERPKSREHGDWSTNIAMILAKPIGLPPREIANALLPRIEAIAGVKSANIAGPGFINIFLDPAAAASLAKDIILQDDKYGLGSSLTGDQINIEFISANPTGPLHLGHTRWAAVGDAIARVLTAAGAKVTREFYINDRGVQMQKFAQSILATIKKIPIPEDGYQGEYISELGLQVSIRIPNLLSLSEDEQLTQVLQVGYELQLKQQQESLHDFNTDFDIWYSEQQMHTQGKVVHALKVLEQKGHVERKEGAIWLRTTDFGDDKDRVLVKSDGEYTYFASDSAYYIDKRERGFDRCLYLLGADHHGYVNRLRAVASCAGDNPDKSIEVLIGQLVKIMRDGAEVKLSKRAGELILLTDLVAAVGVDAVRYSLIRYPVDTPLVLDFDLMTARTNENPVYYVQYAHARINALLNIAAELGIEWQSGTIKFNPADLSTTQEQELLGQLAQYPAVVASSAELREPHRIARYLEDLATGYHRFYDACRVLPSSGKGVGSINVARLHLCRATQIVIRNGLNLLGVTAPERM
ncbi:MAG: arginine--tRNA ligase [Actinobacteria bacterium]|nr:arginine--tRNA ligase [Actinomycetota bacterium]